MLSSCCYGLTRDGVFIKFHLIVISRCTCFIHSSSLLNCHFPRSLHFLFMSLLSQVGLAVGDIESVQKYAFLRNKGKFIDFVFGVERNFPRCITRRFHKPQLVVTGRYVERKISSWYVSVCGWVVIQRYRLVKSALQLRFWHP